MSPLKNFILPRNLIRVTGKSIDAAHSFLNKYFTRNVTPHDSLTGQHGLFLDDKGRILSDAIVISGIPRDESVVYIDCPKEASEGIRCHLEVFAEYSPGDVELIPLESHVLCTKLGANHWEGADSVRDLQKQSPLILPDPRGPLKGTRRLYFPSTDNAHEPPTLDIATYCLSHAEFTDLRYSQGIPEGLGELCHGRSLPTQYSYDYLGGIDFDKGCYLGQELTSRTHFTGVTRKRIVPCRVEGEAVGHGGYRRYGEREGPQGEVKVFDCESDRCIGSLIALQSARGLVMHGALDELSVRVDESRLAYCVLNEIRVEMRCYRPSWWPRG